MCKNRSDLRTKPVDEVFHFFGANRIGKHRTISKSVKDSEDLDHLLENRIFTKMVIGNNGNNKVKRLTENSSNHVFLLEYSPMHKCKIGQCSVHLSLRVVDCYVKCTQVRFK